MTLMVLVLLPLLVAAASPRKLLLDPKETLTGERGGLGPGKLGAWVAWPSRPNCSRSCASSPLRLPIRCRQGHRGGVGPAPQEVSTT